MVILNLKLNNIYSFKNFEVNFSYPKKLSNSLIGNESLRNIPSFRYKKLNLIVGPNACGKTSLIKSIWGILLFLSRGDKVYFLSMTNQQTACSNIEIDFVDDDFLYRVKISSKKRITEFKQEATDVLVAHNKIELKQKDSYENKCEDLDRLNYDFKDYREAIDELNVRIGWRAILPATEESFDTIQFMHLNKAAESDYIDILFKVLNTLDPSISNVFKSRDSNDAYVIVHENNQRIILQEGNPISSIQTLSSGTKYGVNIANMMYSIKHHLNGIYLVDEQFSYVNSDVEAAILSTMVSMLGDNEQIFFTSHNSSILSLSFPLHSLYFMKKEIIDGKSNITIDCASAYENRNNVSAKNMFDNDVFGTSPKLDKIFNIGD